MRLLLLVPAVVVLGWCVAGAAPARAEQPTADEAHRLEKVRRILESMPLIDGHNDLPEKLRERARNHLDSLDLDSDTARVEPPSQTNLPRLRRGGVGGTFFAAWVPGRLRGPEAAQMMFEQIDVIHRLVERHPETLALATSAEEVERAHRAGRIAALIGVEGGHAIANSLATLRQAYACGARYLTLTHLQSNDWADAAVWPGVGPDSLVHGGLTPFGLEVVREMNRLGMLVDLSHTADATMLAALEVSEAPVIFSHAGARAVCDHPRNVPDDILRRVADNGGVVMVDFVPGFVSAAYRDWEVPVWAEWQRLEKLYPGDRARVEAEMQAWRAQHPAPLVTLAQVADHIDHVRQVAGIEHVGLGSDFDGADEFPAGLEDPSRFPALLSELLRRGYSETDLKRLAGGNLLRVMRQAERVAERLQQRRPASDALIQDLDRPRP
ncbi:MAG TPA: dipeptidase [Candidatus Saccharimonadales bacterium]|nr:dipeptidase [Candidatus Saccharimonadales bacterium]